MDDDRVVVRLDLHPARLRVVGTSYDNLRVVITDTDLIAYRLGPNNVAEVTASWPITGEVTGVASIGYTVPTPAGDVWVESSGGCGGCGSRLGQIDLFPGRTRVTVGMR